MYSTPLHTGYKTQKTATMCRVRSFILISRILISFFFFIFPLSSSLAVANARLQHNNARCVFLTRWCVSMLYFFFFFLSLSRSLLSSHWCTRIPSTHTPKKDNENTVCVQKIFDIFSENHCSHQTKILNVATDAAAHTRNHLTSLGRRYKLGYALKHIQTQTR